MKRILPLFLSILLLFSLTACDTGTPGSQSSSDPGNIADIQPPEDLTDDSYEGPTTLVAFFSRQNNAPEGVEAVASATLSENDVTLLSSMIAELDGNADIFQIITTDPYPADYNEATTYATEEYNAGTRPELASHVENMENYDVIYLGYPVWWGHVPMAVISFLEEYDFTGKTIVPFCTHEGGRGNSFSEVAEYAPQATVLPGFDIRGNQADGAQEALETWMRDNGLIN